MSTAPVSDADAARRTRLGQLRAQITLRRKYDLAYIDSLVANDPDAATSPAAAAQLRVTLLDLLAEGLRTEIDRARPHRRADT